ncbi:spore coat protein CotJB [Faecalicatena orotica]|uniref:spore coat protein CotJB n=1 Tax=Faecalicatena orotica TaxID=1544 RepID=UPI003216BF82
MQEEHLAIASIPIQQWGALYDEKEAMAAGTIFRDLNKPFFAAEIEKKDIKEAAPKSEEQRERETLLTKIAETSFLLDDLTLYLDTHMSDTQALDMYSQKTKERDELKKRFAAKFYPLTRDCIIYCESGGKFCWQDGPMPWEGACV